MNFLSNRLPIFVGLNVILLTHPVYSQQRDDKLATDYQKLHSEIVNIVLENFFDKSKLGGRFAQLAEASAAKVGNCESSEQFAKHINNLLAMLGSSHTTYLTPQDPEYYYIADIFSSVPSIKKMLGDTDTVRPTIGVIVQYLNGLWIVASVLPGGRAEAAGIRIGDVLLSMNNTPFTPIDSLRTAIANKGQLTAKRGGEQIDFDIIVDYKSPKQEFMEALEHSIRLIPKSGKNIGYAQIYSYAHSDFQDILEDSIAFGKLAQADALVIDLRWGIGGANPKYLNIFHQDVPVLKTVDREGNQFSSDSQWRKPCVILVNETTRSGKEVFAFGSQKHNFAKIVGTKTAGAVVAGSPFPLSNGDLLYLAVRDVWVDQVRLEGQGVTPDILCEFDIEEANGVDTQFETAIEQASKMVEENQKR